MSKLILIRGLPGSGKSTLAKTLSLAGYYHLETDMYWGPAYKFDIAKLKDAHEWCQWMVHKTLNDGHNVVVSNTFTTIKEMEPYLSMAREFGIKPQIILCQGNFGNIHNVPEDVIDRMTQRFEVEFNGLDLS